MGPVNVTLCKPFYERVGSLISLVFFDSSDYTNERTKSQDSAEHRSYFEGFFVPHKRVKTHVNLSLKVQAISIYLPLMYHRESDMFLIHVKVLRFFKREHENNMANLYNMNEKQNGNVNQFMNGLQKTKKIEKIANNEPDIGETSYDLKPLFITLDCMRLAFVTTYDWEQRENLFLIEYKRLKGDDPIKKSFLDGIETILETLPIRLRMEEIYTRIQVGHIDERKRNFKRRIYPQTKKINLDLPFLNINLSIKHLYLLQQLASIWDSKGYELFDIIGQPK